MPKKFRGENTKASSAKERKATKAAEEKDARDKATEDARWEDGDKQIAKKNMRKEEREQKRLDELKRKQENKLLAQQEDEEMAQSMATTATATKVTQFQLQQQKQQADAAAKEGADVNSHLDVLLMENTNRTEEVISATGVDEALRVLSVGEGDGGEGGGGKGRVNMAAAYRSFEEQRLPSIKKENPSLKLSQLKQRIRKEWHKSPSNPLNHAQS